MGKKRNGEKNIVLTKAAVLLFWLALWQGVSVLVDNEILLVGPVETLRAMLRLLPESRFWEAVGGTAVKVLGGFGLGGLCGIVCAGMGYRFRLVREILSPFLSAVRSIPIVSFVILLLIWQGSGRISFFISLLVVFPILYGNTLNGLLGMPKELVQAAKLLQVSLPKRIFGIYLPEIYPEMKSGLELAIGMGFKSGIAAEVIGQPVGSVGNALYQAKIFLQTDEVFAYTLTAICAAWLAEKLLVFLWSRFWGRRDGADGSKQDG